MFNSKERMDFIIEYISAYKEKIEMANKQGLFDSAKMFELFAIEICKLFYGQKFKNLNDGRVNYPYFDLISEDKQLFIQVSTIAYVPTKIKSTLENIRDSKDEKYSQISKVVFFVLYNDSIDKVKEYTGSSQIGNISFTKKDNLITTNDIIEKAKNSIDFQEKLYAILKQEFENFNQNLKKLNNALEISKNIGIKSIDTLINGEYEINRDNLIEKIKKDDCRFISIQGREGSGKSALCKKIIENDNIVLYARAERFVEENHIENIWNFNVREILEFLNDKKIVFFIDALEFIADSPKTKFDLLESLYSIASEYKNVYIITSCRTSDKNSFIKLESNFLIKIYEIDEISEKELNLIKLKYPIIGKISNNKEYAPLLKSPFYINMIVSKSIDIDNIEDTNSFREYVWENIIGIKEKSKSYNISSIEVIETINKIVFERARKFLLGIHKDKIDSKIIQALISEGVIIEQGNYIRLKYDIFEDICFEHYFDKVFDECKGEYQTFYNEIEKLGRCVYRRYQIWISNKLFVQLNRCKFLYSLIFSDKIPPNWKMQTEIGIIKSRFCNEFFEEQTENIIEHKLISEFIRIINLYAFDPKMIDLGNGTLDIQLIPIGKGRDHIIQILEEREIYKENIISWDDVIKLCLDYAKQDNKEIKVMMSICIIMEYYIDSILKDTKEKYYNIMDKIETSLETLYRLANVSKEWIKKFFEMLIKNYIKGNYEEKRISEKIIEWTLKNPYPILITELSSEMCLMANILWLHKTEDEEKNGFYVSDSFSQESMYGLSEEAEHYRFSYKTVNENVFLYNLFVLDFYVGLKWAIEFINKTVEEYAKNKPECVTKIVIKFNKDSGVKEYFGNPNMWLAGIMDNGVPELIGDIIYWLKKIVLNSLENYKNNKEVMIKFANNIREIIYSKSNNIMMLTIIEAIGIHFQSELPGFALELATSIEIVHFDVNRYMLYLENPTLKMLEKQILMTVGLPALKRRYDLDPKCNLNIQTYVSNAQIYFDKTIQDKCYNILDYLYTIIKNDKENARDYLQIQKMDMRNAKATKINDETIILEPKITGEAKSIIDNNEYNIANKKLNDAIRYYNEKRNAGENDINLIVNIIDMIVKVMTDKNLKVQYENILILCISAALSDIRLENKYRENYCKIWLDGMERLFSNDSFVFEISLTPILCNQLNSNTSDRIKNRIKRIILKCLMYKEQNGVITQIGGYIKKYLMDNRPLSKALFNTIIKLSEDEMKHQKYNANYYKMNIEEGKDFNFIPNMQPDILLLDRYIKDNNGKLYSSEKEEIINRYLILEKNLEIDNFDIDNYDISTICYVANCGVTFDDKVFKNIIHNILIGIINIWNYNKEDRNTHEIFDIYQEYEIIELFRREMIQSKSDVQEVIDILFDNIDFTKFTTETVDFYQSIFSGFVCEFFDSYVDLQRRNLCKNRILYIESKVNRINCDNVKIQLYKSLMLSVRNDFRRLEKL